MFYLSKGQKSLKTTECRDFVKYFIFSASTRWQGDLVNKASGLITQNMQSDFL
jgi:hypothetical protein